MYDDIIIQYPSLRSQELGTPSVPLKTSQNLANQTGILLVLEVFSGTEGVYFRVPVLGHIFSSSGI